MMVSSGTNWPTQTTPFPNRLLDEVMPSLKDTEWRLICVVVRQTLGWQAGKGKRKSQDWLTHSQLKRRTNRASAAVSAALDKLIRQQLIEVRNEARELMLTPQDRRRARGRLFYRLHPRLLAGGETPSSESGFQKVKPTKEIWTKGFSNLLSVSESKELVQVPGFSSGRLEVMTITPGEGDEAKRPTQEAIFVPQADTIISLYRNLYMEHLERESPEITEGEQNFLRVSLVRYGATEMKHLLPRFFASRLAFIVRKNHSLTSFLETIEIIRLSRN